MMIVLGKIEVSRKGRRADMGWIDSVKEASLQELTRAVEERTFCRLCIHRIAIHQRRLDGMQPPPPPLYSFKCRNLKGHMVKSKAQKQSKSTILVLSLSPRDLDTLH